MTYTANLEYTTYTSNDDAHGASPKKTSCKIHIRIAITFCTTLRGKRDKEFLRIQECKDNL